MMVLTEKKGRRLLKISPGLFIALAFVGLFYGSAFSQKTCCWSPDSMPAVSSLRDSIDKRINRFEKEILAFEAQDDTVPFPKDAILFTGSSTIRLWKTLAEDMNPLPVMNRGFGGATLIELTHYAERIIYKYKPRAIVVYCGENDLANSFSRVEDVIQEFTRLDSLRRPFVPETHILFISIKPSPSRAFYTPKFNMANQQVQNYIAQYTNDMDYIDITPCMYTKEGAVDETLFRKDMLHMNKEGYTRWTNVIKPVLGNVLKLKVK